MMNSQKKNRNVVVTTLGFSVEKMAFLWKSAFFRFFMGPKSPADQHLRQNLAAEYHHGCELRNVGLRGP